MKNLSASVLARLKNRAKELGLVYNDILIRFAIERVLKRLERSSVARRLYPVRFLRGFPTRSRTTSSS